MKVRIGVAPGRVATSPEFLDELVDALDATGFDSLWLSEVLTAAGYDPIVGLAFAAARSRELKIGTTMLLPGRNIVRLAKMLASLDALSQGRLLVTFVPGLRDSPEREAIGVPPNARGAVIDEVLPVLRRLLAGETVAHDGPAAQFPAFRLSPLPVQQPLEFWLGGSAPAALERCGILGDGWLPSLCAPEEARKGRLVIDEVAARKGRAISPEHFGVSVPYVRDELELEDAQLARARRRPNGELIPIGMRSLRELLMRYIDVGFSKFVVRPLQTSSPWQAELEALDQAVGDLQN